ncbi:Nn.00g060090.m01.CDS01 [Neocucurbitaria sp. VM-36]
MLFSRQQTWKDQGHFRTLEKLHQRQTESPSQTQPDTPGVPTDGHATTPLQSREHYPIHHCDTTLESQGTPELDPDTTTRETSAAGKRRAGTTTPWDPQVLAVRKEPHSKKTRATLARNLLHILGEFPVHDGKSDGQSDECKKKGLQEPLWLLAGLADKGWELNETTGRHSSSRQSTLGESSLKAGLEHLLHKWTPQALHAVEREQRQYFKYGVFASKCDVAPALDPISHAFVRQRSALLTTTILAIGSTAGIAINPEAYNEHVTEALRLHAHVEKLNLVVYATGARSVDIVQAQILLSRWGTAPRTRLEEQRWIRAGMIPRMATEIGLNRPPLAMSKQDTTKTYQLWKNDLRTRAFLMINEYRFSIHNGRQALDLAHFELTEEELEAIAEEPAAQSGRVSPAALYDLFIFDREARQRINKDIGGRHSSLLDAELEHIKAYMEGWMQDRCPGRENPSVNWYLVHEAISCWLLLVTQIGKVRLRKPYQQRPRQQQHQQQLMSSLAVRMFTEVLKVPHAVRTTQRATIFPFAASIVLRMYSRSDLVLPVALQMAGEPGEVHVPTFVREAGVQMLLMLYHNNLNTPGNSTPDHPGGNLQSVPDSQDPNDDGRQQDLPTHMQDINPSELTGTNPGNLQPDNWFPGSTFDGMFSFNVDDFPNVPNMSQQDVRLQDTFFRCYDLEDLDALMSTSNPMNFPDAGALQPQMCMAQPPPANAPIMSHNPHAIDLQMSSEGAFQGMAMNWQMEGVSPCSTVPETNFNGVRDGDHNAQRNLLLSAVDRLIELASKI